MKLRAALVFVVASLVTVLAAAEGCGNSVADCNAACPSGTQACQSQCSKFQMLCSMSDDGGDFQALLTCVANSGNDLVPLPTDCETQQNTVLANCTGTASADAH
jgi:hypothetical protein